MFTILRTTTAAGLLTLTLAACSASIHPGAAAVVEGTDISVAQVDEASVGWCRVQLLNAAQQGITELDNGTVRRQALRDLVTLEVARHLVERDDLDVPRGELGVPAALRDQVEQLIEPEHVDAVISYLEVGNEIRAITIALGEKVTGQEFDPQNPEPVGVAGQEALAAEVTEADVDLDPRFSAGDEGLAASGSLSVWGEPVELDPSMLPATQRCA